MNNIAIIPARAGSKGVIKKNIHFLAGFPLIAYTIQAALHAKSIDHVLVSTDCEHIAQIAKYFGGDAPFLRPEAYAGDKSPDRQYLLHAIKWLKEHKNKEPDNIVLLRPTTPLRQSTILENAILKFHAISNATSLRSVHELPEPPQKMMGIKDGFLEGLFPDDKREEYYNLPRQSFAPAYHPNGYIDILKTNHIIHNTSIYGVRAIPQVTEFATEIDLPQSLDYLEFYIKTYGHELHTQLKNKYPEYSLG